MYKMRWRILLFSKIILIFAGFSVRSYVSGLSNFWETVNSPAFVDKTLFIEHFFKGPDHVVIIAPHHFSKTTNLNMLKAFLEIETAPNGDTVERNLTKNYKEFASHKLNIFRDSEFFKIHFARYPVIRVDLGTVNATTHQNFVDSFQRVIKNLYNEFTYLTKSKKLSKEAIGKFNEVIEPGLPLGIDYLLGSGFQLADLLFQHHDQKCILLVDNYETPIKHAIMSKEVSQDDLDDIVDRLSTFTEKLIKAKDRVFKSLFTGSLTVGQIYTSKVDNLKLLSIFRDEHLNTFYGFTEEDVKALATKFNKKAHIDDMRKWYGGYYVEGTQKLLYNPYSVVHYLNNGTLGPYWFESEHLKGLEPFFDFEKVGEMGEGSVGEDVLIIPHEINTQFKLHQLKDMFCKDEFSVIYVHRMIQFFMEIGYYTASDRFPNAMVGDAVNVGFPNEETRQDFRKLVFTPIFYMSKFKVSDETINEYADGVDRLSADSETYSTLAASVEKIFRKREPRDGAEVLATLRALAAVSKKLPQVDKNDFLFIRRYDNVGVLVNAACKNSSSRQALAQILDKKVYTKAKKNLDKLILVGLFVDKQRRCKVSFLYDKYDIARCEEVTAPPMPKRIPKTTTVPPKKK